MGKKRNRLPWEYCECGCHMSNASVGRHHFGAYLFITDDERNGRVRVYDGGCGNRLSRYYREYASFGQADYQTWRRLKARVKSDRAAESAVLACSGGAVRCVRAR